MADSHELVLLACVEVTTRKGHCTSGGGGLLSAIHGPLIAERIAELRKEIAQIQALNDTESRSAPYQNRDAVRQRRAERLKEIMAELRTPESEVVRRSRTAFPYIGPG